MLMLGEILVTVSRDRCGRAIRRDGVEQDIDRTRRDIRQARGAEQAWVQRYLPESV